MRNIAVIILILFIVSCARQGTPSGGPKDTEPPKFLGSNPDTLALNVKPDLKEIEIDFDEYVILKDYTNQIIVSPPLGTNATFMPVGSPRKSVKIKLNEPLQPNTTYNINFGNSLQDNNEGNKLSYFQYVFSTGDYIDSLEISGKANVLSAKEIPENLLVGLYKIDSAYSDSLILKEKPFYIARPDSAGIFKLNYLHPGKYQMIAFDDKVQNMQFDLGRENFGYIEQPVELTENQNLNIQLFDQQPPYKAGKADQKGYGQLVFRFQGQPDSVEIEPLDFDFTTSKISYEPKSDSLNFWFDPKKDTIEEKSKRINFLVKHLEQTDTVSLVYSNAMRHQLTYSQNSEHGYSPAKKLELSTNYPIEKLDSNFISVKKDTLNLGFKLIRDEKNESRFTVDFPIELSSNYEVELLPGAITDFFGETNDTISLDFRTKTRNDFGNLKLILQDKPEKPFWIQLWSEKDKLINEKYTSEPVFEYKYLNPGNYYFKILVDENENQFWDTGDFFTKKQPEKSYVYPGFVNVRALWDVNETWILNPEPLPEKEKSPTETEEDLP
jgi:hypothetical protein